MFWSFCVLIPEEKRVSGPCKVSEFFSEHLLSPCSGSSLMPGTTTLLLIFSEMQLTDRQFVLLNQVSVAFPYLICLFLVFTGASNLKVSEEFFKAVSRVAIDGFCGKVALALGAAAFF